MKNLFLVDGASATGKSDLLKRVKDYNAGDVGYVVKGTTRPERDYERGDPGILLDLEFLSEPEFDGRNYDYTYTYGGARYGFHRKDLMQALVTRDNVFVIVRNTVIIDRIAQEFSWINVVPIFIYTDRAQLAKRLEAECLDPDLIQWRLDRSEVAFGEYFGNTECYREVLINNSSRAVFHSIIDKLIGKYKTAPSIDPNSIAVMMSFDKSNVKLLDYFDAMERAARVASPAYRCVRVDTEPGTVPIAPTFRKVIERSRCVIADLTGERPNVYYELGYAHARGKTCIITAEEGTRLHTHAQAFKIVFYESVTALYSHLAAELQLVLGGPSW
ncbi:MAG TPA: hypothetical protein VK669_13525 [Candidatus Limnocylindrales bacterium]|nr:hypothetical protein [Candidatus Limnocylindrales bacterium]